MPDEKPIESRFQEYKDFAKRHKLAAIIICVWLVAPTIWSVIVSVKSWNIGDFESEVDGLKGIVEEKTSEILRLESLLTPFRTIALEKFTGSEREALNQLADYIIKLQSQYQEQQQKLIELNQEVVATKAMYGPVILTPESQEITKNESGGYNIIIRFKPSNNSRVDGYYFSARVVRGDGRITSFSGSGKHHAMATGREKRTDDGLSAECAFNPFGGLPTLALSVTDLCSLEITGNHLSPGYTLEINDPENAEHVPPVQASPH